MRKFTRINHISTKWKADVALYFIVSTAHAEQIENLSNQIEYYRQMFSSHINWVLVDIYANIKYVKTISGRAEFQTMLADCKTKKIERIIKSQLADLDVTHRYT
ncbi:recombinase family protein [Clostridium tagluense]|uniref:recombinase family protein n=1 Tax=Clostridium tagluense TaxID=360422 RepID=UPI001CF109D1|nr:recombinase family protein [Clostridium tagluense]MCB2301111.1 recombinase family protein [Clostridium tagluense]